jgi:nitrile hydratase
MHGFGPVTVEPNEPVFHAPWERRVLGMAFQVVGFGWTTLDAFRHGIERMNPITYLTASYYARWLASLETVLVDAGVLAPGEVQARVEGKAPPPATSPAAGLPRRAGGFVRAVDTQPAFAAGQSVRARNAHPTGHTRLPRYVRGRRGVVARVHAAFVFPDANAHGAGEAPQYLYTVRFAASELWGRDAEAGSTVYLDLFEPYLEPV